MKVKSMLITLLLIIAGLQVTRAQKVVLYKTGSQAIEYDVSELDSIVFVEAKTGLVQKIVLNMSSLSLQLNTVEYLTATVFPEDAENKNLLWESSNDEVAEVNAKGRVIANGIGNCVITCRATDGSGVKAECQVEVSLLADNAMSSADQKEYMETIAWDFMDMMPSSDFNEIAELYRFIRNNYEEDYDWDSVEKWAKDAYKAARESLGTTTTESGDWWNDWWSDYIYKYNYIYYNYRALLMASNFTGHFTASNGRWIKTNASDLQFIFTDKRNRQCVLKLETSGSVKKVHAYNEDDWIGYDDSFSDNAHIYNEYYDRTQYTIGVPERIVVTLTQGDSQVVQTTINIDLGSLSGEEFDISKNNFSVSMQIEWNNGYKFDVSRVAYTANTNASVSFTMSKNGTNLVTIGVAADVRDIPSVNVSAFSSENFDEDDYDFDIANAKNAYVKLDILGRMQIQGSLSDVRKFLDYLDYAEDNDGDERIFKSYVTMANSLADVNLYYDGKNVKQAAVRMESFAHETWYGQIYWEVEPVIFFYDGSSYSTFDVFFNEKDFKKTIDSFKSLVNMYAALVDEHVDW